MGDMVPVLKNGNHTINGKDFSNQMGDMIDRSSTVSLKDAMRDYYHEMEMKKECKGATPAEIKESLKIVIVMPEMKVPQIDMKALAEELKKLTGKNQ